MNRQRYSPRRYELYTLPNTRTDLRSCTQKGTTLAGRIVEVRDINHTRDIYRCYIRDFDYEFARFGTSQTQRQVNAFNMSALLHPPTTRFVLLCL